MKRIPLTQGKFAIVDSDDFKWLSTWKWCAQHARKECWYAGRVTYHKAKQRGGKPIRENILMHRAILERHYGCISKDLETDHRDRDGLNNRKKNLRLVTPSVNCKNRATHNGYHYGPRKPFTLDVKDNNGKIIKRVTGYTYT